MGHGEEGLSPPPPLLHWLGGEGCWHFRPWNCQIWVYQQLSSLQLFSIIRDLRFQKRLWILEFSATSVKIWFVFGGFRSVLYVISRFLAFELQSLLVSLYSCQSFLPALYRNMASLNSQGEIVLIELPNPGETQIWEGENELVRSVPTHIYFCSFCSWLALFFLQRRIRCYGNGLIDVEEKPKILKRFWRRRSRVIRNSRKWQRKRGPQ